MIEKHVPTRETCERLKAAGFGQDTIFSWRAMTKQAERMGAWIVQSTEHIRLTLGTAIAAPLATEIMEASWGVLEASLSMGPSGYYAQDDPTEPGQPPIWAEHATNPAEALALLFLAVKEKP